MNIDKWLKENTQSLKGKTVAITGATGGIGYEVCRYLAKLDSTIILLNRNSDKSEFLENWLKNQFPNTKIINIYLDLENFSSVKTSCEKLKSYEIDFFIHNAGVYDIPRYKCATRYDNVYQTNFVSPYYITKELMPNIKQGFIAVGSIAHNYSKIDVNDIDFSSRKASSKVYGNSKRFLMFSLYELFSRQNKISLSICHPGITFTNMTSHFPKFIFALIKYPMKIIFMKPKKACLSIIKGIFESTEYNAWIGPKIFNIWGLPKKQKISTCSKEESEKIFEISEKIYEELKKADNV